MYSSPWIEHVCPDVLLQAPHTSSFGLKASPERDAPWWLVWGGRSRQG
jgi:hypothetical protein